MEQREHTDSSRVVTHSLGSSERRVLRAHLPLRVLNRWLGSLRYWYSPVGRPKMIRKLRVWAHDNAFTLLFMSVGFATTWIIIVVVEVIS